MFSRIFPAVRIAAFALFAVAASAQTTTPAKPVITSYDATSSTPSFHGTSDPGVAINVATYSYPALTTTAGADGTWNVSWSGTPLTPGTYYFNAFATNAAGVRSATSDSAVVKSPPTSAPVIGPVPDQETTWQYREKDYDQLLLLNVTNLPDRIDATNLPPGMRISTRDPSGIYYTYGGITGGKFHVTLTATNSVGTSAPVSFDWTIHPAPTYWFVPNGRDYVPGNLLSFRVDFSAPVVVTGSPFIPLWGTKKAFYASGSGTKTLTFSYTIAADDPSVSGFAATDILLGDGSITTTDCVSAGRHMSFYFGSPPTIYVVNSAAQPAAITSVTAYGPTPAWNQVSVTIAFSQNVRLAGPLLLHLTIGGMARTVAPSSVSGNKVTFVYKPQPGDQGTVVLQSPLESGGSVVGENGLAANLAFNPPDTSTMSVDGNPPPPPVITSVTQGGMPTFTGTADPNSRIEIVMPSGRTGVATTAGSNGQFSLTWGGYGVPPLPAGTYSFSATATDALGNTSAPSAAVAVTVSYPHKPTTPVITSVSNGTVYGTADPGTTLYLLRDGNFVSYSSTTVQSDGTWHTFGWFSNDNSQSLTFTAVAVDSAKEASDLSAPVTYVLKPVPVVQNATVTGRVGAAIEPVQLQATNSPSSFSAASNLFNYGLSLSQFGILTGTPTQPADGVAVSFTASNNAGQSAPGTITLNIAAATTTPPPPSGTKTDQTITFSSPVSAVMIGQPIALGATSSAGLPISYTVIGGNATLSGTTLTPLSTATLIVRAASAGNDAYNPASTDVNFGNPQKAAQTMVASTTTQTVKAGSTVTLEVTSSSGLPVVYTVISGPATVSGNTLTVTGTSGTVQVRASQAGSDTYAPASDLTLNFTIGPISTSRLVNISSRLHVSGNDAAGASIAGFVVTGSSPKQFLIRGVGPTLAAYGISSPLASPQLKLYDEHSAVVATNAGWNDDPQIAAAASAVGAFRYNAGSKDAALLVMLAPGTHTVQLLSNGSGTGMIEVYDVSAVSESTKQLINISTRGTVGSGDDVLIGGFVITGDQPKRVLIRGIGPKLADFGVAGALRDAAVTVYDSKQAVVAKNDNWGTPQPLAVGQQVGTAGEITAAATATGAFPLSAGSADAAVLLTLPPGGYSAVVTGANNASGAAMVEIYEVPE